jgi:hypothetical protein
MQTMPSRRFGAKILEGSVLTAPAYCERPCGAVPAFVSGPVGE